MRRGDDSQAVDAVLEDLRDEMVTEEELDEVQAEIESAVAMVVEWALPIIVEDVYRRLEADPFTPAAARGPEVVHTDYSPLVSEAFDAVDRE